VIGQILPTSWVTKIITGTTLAFGTFIGKLIEVNRRLISQMREGAGKAPFALPLQGTRIA